MSEQTPQESLVDSMPTAEADALGKLGTIRKGRQLTWEAKIPAGYEGEGEVAFVWRILNGSEKQMILGRAVKRMQSLEIPLELRGRNDLEDECIWQILAEAMRDPDNIDKPLAMSVDEVRENMTIDERDYLMNQYLDLEEMADPDLRKMTPAEIQAIESAIEKKQRAPLIRFGASTLATYLLTGGSQS